MEAGYVREVAKKDGTTVVLTGDGGDEFFCGYNSYESMKKAQMLGLMADWFILYVTFPRSKGRADGVAAVKSTHYCQKPR